LALTFPNYMILFLPDIVFLWRAHIMRQELVLLFISHTLASRNPNVFHFNFDYIPLAYCGFTTTERKTVKGQGALRGRHSWHDCAVVLVC